MTNLLYKLEPRLMFLRSYAVFVYMYKYILCAVKIKLGTCTYPFPERCAYIFV